MRSNEWRPELEALYQAALDARHADKPHDGVALCARAIALLLPEESRCRAILHFERAYQRAMTGDLDGAVTDYRTSIESGPRVELTSLSLFHNLLKLERWMEAFEEAVRFTALRDSPEYRELFFSPGFLGGWPERQQQLSDEVRANLLKWN